MPLSTSGWKRTIQFHFILCTFVGIITLESLREPILRLLGVEGLDILGSSVIAGLVVTVATFLIHHFAFRKFGKRYFGGVEEREQRRRRRRGLIVAFGCGALCPLYLYFPVLVPGLAVVFFLLILSNARTFLKRAGVILRPGSYPRPVDIFHLLFLYGCLIASFTVLNRSIGHIHMHLDPLTPAFRGFTEGAARTIEHLYFTVVVMTTLGFGDITPNTTDAKLVVGMEVVIAYLFFALLVGTITRGILPHEDEEESPQEDPPESR